MSLEEQNITLYSGSEWNKMKGEEGVKKKIRKVIFSIWMILFVMGTSGMIPVTVQAEEKEAVQQNLNGINDVKNQKEKIEETNKKIKKLFLLSILSVILFAGAMGIALVVCIRAKRKERKK